MGTYNEKREDSVTAVRSTPSHRRRVKLAQVGSRLDQFLAVALPQWSRGAVQELIRAGAVRIDGVPVTKLHHKLALGQEVNWLIQSERPSLAEGSLQKAPPAIFADINVIAETDAMVVIAKPAGIAMHPVGRQAALTLTDWLSTYYPQIAGVGDQPSRPGMVHRLDKDTSGVVVIAKHDKAFRALKRLFHDRLMEKEYVALVYGNLASPSGVIDKPIGRVRGSARRSVPAGKREFGGELRGAVTEYGLHTRYPQYDLLSVKPKTGRTHQIRVHLASLGHPIVGDRLYRFKEHRRDPLIPPHQLLHAEALAFTLFGKPYRFKAPLPGYFSDILSVLALQKGEKG